jgi:hypothetical protein
MADALVRYGSGLRESDLGAAYKKASIAFRGQLEHSFVVLHERQEIPKNGSFTENISKTKHQKNV